MHARLTFVVFTLGFTLLFFCTGCCVFNSLCRSKPEQLVTDSRGNGESAIDNQEDAGSREIDIDVTEWLSAWIDEQDAEGWNITGFETDYTGLIVSYEFRPTRLDIAIRADQINPFHQRNWIEDIVRQWFRMYPANLKPGYNLRVTFFDMEIDSDYEIGWSEIDTDGNIDTHHLRTQDVI